MFISKEVNVFLLLFCAILLLPTINCQMSESSSALDLISDSMRSLLGLDSMVKTFKKFSEGMIPFPLFVPIIPKNRVIELFRGKKPAKEQDSIEQISESNAKLNKMQIPLPLQQQLLAKMNPNYHQFSDQMFFNMRPPPPEIMPEMQFIMNPGMQLPVPHHSINDDIRPNDLNLDNDYNEENNNNNNYAERFESSLQSDEYVHSDDRKIPTATDVIHNWQIIDEELKKIGHQLGKLGKYLNRNAKQE